MEAENNKYYAAGPRTQNEISKLLSSDTRLGRIAEYLWELELAGFIAKDHAWNFTSGLDVRMLFPISLLICLNT
jgi:hypothetical protein